LTCEPRQQRRLLRPCASSRLWQADRAGRRIARVEGEEILLENLRALAKGAPCLLRVNLSGVRSSAPLSFAFDWDIRILAGSA